MGQHNVYGANVGIEIPKEVFPTQAEMDKMDQLAPGGEHGWFDSCYENAKLHYRSWLPKGEAKGVLVYMHGINTHCNTGTVVGGRKLATSLLIDSFQKQGIAVYAFEMYGHGFSEGTRFLIPDSWENNKNDYITFCNLAAKNHSSKIPFFVSGASYGACLSIHVAKHFQENPKEGPENFDSMLLVAPAIIGDMPGFPVYQILRYALAPLFPRWVPFFMPNSISPERIWRDEEVLKLRTDTRYREMGIDGGGLPFKLGTALNLVLALEAVRAKAIPGFKVPFCIVHGTNDAGVPIAGSELMMEQAATPDGEKEFYRMEGAMHDVFTDPVAEEAMEHWVKFAQKRMKLFK